MLVAVVVEAMVVSFVVVLIVAVEGFVVVTLTGSLVVEVMDGFRVALVPLVTSEGFFVNFVDLVVVEDKGK